jgi:NosR/NirI family transcriptional regulator, nitrous oxide reductase regulator
MQASRNSLGTLGHETSRGGGLVFSLGWRRNFQVLLNLLLGTIIFAQVQAAELDKAAISAFFPAPFVVGEKDTSLGIWPIFKPAGGPEDAKPDLDPQGRTVWPFGQGKDPGGSAMQLLGYAFETVDVSPVPGYSGKLINTLITLDTKGTFIDARLISHREPLFVGGLGDELMGRFAAQYRGLTVKQTVRIISDSQVGANEGKIAPKGVTVELMDKSIMQSAVKIAGKKLGIVGSIDPDKLAKLRNDIYEPADWQALAQAGLIQSASFNNQAIEKPFLGTPAAPPGGAIQGDQAAIEFRVALLSLPQVGRNLLDEAGYKKVEFSLSKGLHSLLIVSRGRLSFIGDDYVLAGGLNRMVLVQGGTEIELKDFIYDHPIKLPEGFDRKDAKVVHIAGYSGIDPGQPLELRYRVKRSYGTFNRQSYEGLYPFNYQIPVKFLVAAPVPEAGWVNAWRNQKINVLVLVAGLLVLSAALSMQRWLVKRSKRLERFRLGFLLFTLVFIGWYAQGQLSIVNITGVIEALVRGASLDFLLFDPMSFTLWAFVLLSLLVWGRGTFCGWLCPFGALQELISKVVKLTGFSGWRLHTRLDAQLKWVKYVVLAVVLGTAFIAPQYTSSVAEVEPFKTSISLYFVRSWPYLLWALLCLALSVSVYRGYCRYICPLGAALAIAGKVRVFNWIPRRKECGTPCQTCRHRCEYQAIAPQGKVDYQECFQCLDCVEIHDSEEKCAPLIGEKKRARRVIPVALEPTRVGDFSSTVVARARG